MTIKDSWTNAKGEVVVIHADDRMEVLPAGTDLRQVKTVAAVEQAVKGTRVVATLGDRGTVRFYAAPRPYFSLSADELAALEAKRKALLATISDPVVSALERSRAARELADVEQRLEIAKAATHPVSTLGG